MSTASSKSVKLVYPSHTNNNISVDSFEQKSYSLDTTSSPSDSPITPPSTVPSTVRLPKHLQSNNSPAQTPKVPLNSPSINVNQGQLSPPQVIPPKLTPNPSPSIERLYYVPPPTPPKFRSSTLPPLYPMSPGNSHRTPRGLKNARNLDLMDHSSKIIELPEDELEFDDNDRSDNDKENVDISSDNINDDNDEQFQSPTNNVKRNRSNTVVTFDDTANQPRSAFDDASIRQKSNHNLSFWDKLRRSSIISPSNTSGNLSDDNSTSNDSSSHISIHLYDTDIDNIQTSSTNDFSNTLANLPTQSIKQIHHVPDKGVGNTPFLAHIFDRPNQTASFNCFWLGFVLGPPIWLVGGWLLDSSNGMTIQRVKNDDINHDWSSEWNEINVGFKYRKKFKEDQNELSRSESGEAMSPHRSQSSLSSNYQNIFTNKVKPRKFYQSKPNNNVLPPIISDNPERWTFRCRLAAIISVPIAMACLIAAIVGIIVTW